MAHVGEPSSVLAAGWSSWSPTKPESRRIVEIFE